MWKFAIIFLQRVLHVSVEEFPSECRNENNGMGVAAVEDGW